MRVFRDIVLESSTAETSGRKELQLKRIPTEGIIEEDQLRELPRSPTERTPEESNKESSQGVQLRELPRSQTKRIPEESN